MIIINNDNFSSGGSLTKVIFRKVLKKKQCQKIKNPKKIPALKPINKRLMN